MWESITAYLPEFFSALGMGGITWFFARRKNRAELAGTEIENLDKAVEIWRKLAADLKKEYSDLKVEFKAAAAEWKADRVKLHKEISDLMKKMNEKS